MMTAGGLGFPAVASAQETNIPGISGVDGDFAKKDGWDVTAGGGLAVMPTYEGSDRDRITPVPFVRAVYDDMFSFGVDGLSAYWHQNGLRIGAGLVYGAGRKDYESNGIIQSGDNRLNGLGDINGAAGLKLFGSYNVGRLNLSTAVTKYEGSDNKGVIADLGANLPFRLNDKLMVTAHVGATWANGEYMQTFFGVTPTQSANSGFSEFTAHAGVKDVDAGLRADYRLDQHWFVSTNIGVKRLEGDAAKSPITFANTEGTFMTVLGYRF
jgi:outer membrane protein